MRNRVLSLVIAMCIALGTGIVPVSAADTPSVGYEVTGEVSGNKLNVTVAVTGAVAYSGRLALAYDKNLLALSDKSSLSKAVKKGSGVSITTEGHAPSVLLEDGRVMFAWYSTNNYGIKAQNGAVIATISFDLKGDVSDFSRNTLGLYYVNQTMVDGWDSSCEIAANVGGALAAYRNTETDENYRCGISFDYPNCDYIPPNVYNVSVRVKNSDGKEIPASVMFDTVTADTDSVGRAEIPMAEGTYFYRVTSPGYEVKNGYYIVGEADSIFNVTLRSYGQIAIDEAAELKIGYADGDDEKNVTTNLVLPTETRYGTVSWVSDSRAVTEYGAVSRGEDDIPVTLTATVDVNGATASKTFEVIVKSRLTAEEKNAAIVATDKDSLEIGYAPGDYSGAVTVDLTLGETGANGSTISWVSSNESVIYPTGAVNRPKRNTEVTLTAYIMRGTAHDTKTFIVTVKGTEALSVPTAKPTPTVKPTPTPDNGGGTEVTVPDITPTPTVTDNPDKLSEEIVQRAADTLEIGYIRGDSEVSVTENLTLPTVGEGDAAVEWTSSQPDVITPDGDVTRGAEDTDVTLTATVTHGGVTAQKSFTVTVKGDDTPAPTEEPTSEDEDVDNPDIEPTPRAVNESAEESNEIVQRIINALEIGYSKGDSETAVTKSLTLPTVGTENTGIKWTSSKPAVITPYGGVVCQAEDTEVTLTATVTRGSVTEEKSFTVTVKAADEIPVNPNNGQEEEIKVKNTRRRTNRNVTAETAVNGSDASTADGAVKDKETDKTHTNTETKERKRFIDIDDVSWAQTAINTLADRGVIKGTSETTYSPHDNIRRADFVMLLVKLYDLDSDITKTFEDVREDSYYYECVSKAASLGIISGVDATRFNPEGSITRQDMITMTYRALVQLGKAGEQTDDLSAFKDAKEVSDYALSSVRYMVGAGYIHGDNSGYLTPLSNTTRAETAVFLYGLTQ